jgi:hypothetical protein
MLSLTRFDRVTSYCGAALGLEAGEVQKRESLYSLL